MINTIRTPAVRACKPRPARISRPTARTIFARSMTLTARFTMTPSRGGQHGGAQERYPDEPPAAKARQLRRNRLFVTSVSCIVLPINRADGLMADEVVVGSQCALFWLLQTRGVTGKQYYYYPE